MKALEIYTNVGEADYRGTHFMADVLYDDTKNGATFGPTIAVMEYLQQMVTTSPLAKSDGGIKGGSEVMQPCRILVNQIIRQVDQEVDQGVIKFDSVDWVHKRPEIIGKFAETTYRLKDWQTSWNIQEQVIPDEALVVVALGITIATQGWGALFAANTLGFGSIAADMVGVGIASVASSYGTSVLQSGDPLTAVASLFTDHYLRSLGTSLVTAGLIGSSPGVLQGFSQRLMMHGLRSVVRAGVSSVIENRRFSEAIKDGALCVLVDSIGGVIAEKIGAAAHAKVNPLSSLEHKLAHFALGAGMGAALDRNHSLSAALASGAGVVIGETVAETLVDRKQIEREVLQDMRQQGQRYSEEGYRTAYREKLQPYINAGRLVAGSVIAATGRDSSIAIMAATNALENNFAGVVPMPEMGGIRK